MPTVPFKAEEASDEKRETTGELTTILATEGIPVTLNAKPEAIVRPLRRREPSDDDNKTPDLIDLEAQILEKLTKLEKPRKAQKDPFKEFEKKYPPQFRWSQSRDSKKSSRDVSDYMGKFHLKLSKSECEEKSIRASFTFTVVVLQLLSHYPTKLAQLRLKLRKLLWSEIAQQSDGQVADEKLTKWRHYWPAQFPVKTQLRSSIFLLGQRQLTSHQ